ncbi:basic region leucine zipper [Cooperia oncophora]
MLSRFTRMSSLGAHLVSGCSALRDPPSAPKPVPKLTTSGRSGSLITSSENSSGCSPISDPFLWHDHENFLAELSELDHLKNDLSPRTTPERERSTLDDSAEWNSILHSMEWIDKFEALDIPKIESDCSSDCPESTSQDETSDFLDKTASLIDWKAWNSYLGVDDDLNLDAKPDEKATGEEQSHLGVCQAASGDVEVKTEGVSSDPYEPKPENIALNSRLNEIESSITRSSGPLTWLPCVKEEDQCSELSARSTPSLGDVTAQIRTLKRRGVKMKPPGDDETNHRRWLNREAAFRYRERKRIEQLERKKAGLLGCNMPPGDDETNHRRWLNREAAFRYRERKRIEQLERKKELEDLLYRNNFLKQQVRVLSKEVALWQEKLSSANI